MFLYYDGVLSRECDRQEHWCYVLYGKYLIQFLNSDVYKKYIDYCTLDLVFIIWFENYKKLIFEYNKPLLFHNVNKYYKRDWKNDNSKCTHCQDMLTSASQPQI